MLFFSFTFFPAPFFLPCLFWAHHPHPTANLRAMANIQCVTPIPRVWGTRVVLIAPLVPRVDLKRLIISLDTDDGRFLKAYAWTHSDEREGRERAKVPTVNLKQRHRKYHQSTINHVQRLEVNVWYFSLSLLLLSWLWEVKFEFELAKFASSARVKSKWRKVKLREGELKSGAK